MSRFPYLTAMVAVACSVLAGAGAWVAPVAQAQEDPNLQSWVVPQQVEEGHVNFNKPISYCIAGNDGFGCGISRTTTLTYTVSAEMGISGEEISASLGISRSEAVGVTANCSAAKASPGMRYVAYPTETRHYYYVMEETGVARYTPEHLNDPMGPAPYSDKSIGTTTRSDLMYAAVPDGGVYCRVEPLKPLTGN